MKTAHLGGTLINVRRKGHNFERQVAAEFRTIWPEASRGAQSRSGDDAPDVDNTPWWVECKCGKRPSIPAAVKQAVAATDGRPILVIVKDDRQKPFVLEESKAKKCSVIPSRKIRESTFNNEYTDIEGRRFRLWLLSDFLDSLRKK